MKTVVVGGNSRDIGKTSVMAGLIRAFRSLEWTAVKITQYGHGVCSLDGRPCECEPREHPFVLVEEKDHCGPGDTCRYLAAGARRSLWLRVREGRLGEGFPLLERAVCGDAFVMIESNSVLAYLKPSVYLMVLDGSKSDFKSSCLKFLDRCDALVPVGSGFDLEQLPAPYRDRIQSKPVFPVTNQDYFNLELCRFVSKKLRPEHDGIPLATLI